MTSSPWRTLATAFTVFAIVIGGLVVWSLVGRPDPQREQQSQTYTHAVTRIIFDGIDSGDIRVGGGSAHPKGTVSIDRLLTWSRTKPTFNEFWDGDTLRISVHCVKADWWWSDNCSIDYGVRVPSDVAVEIETTSGDIEVTGTTGAVKVTSTSGGVDLADLTGPVTARLTSGDLTTDNLSSTTLDTEVTSGDVRLHFDVVPRSVAARVTSGDVTVLVPAGDYRVDVDTVSGDERVTVPDSTIAPNTITVTSTSGDVEIGYRAD